MVFEAFFGVLAQFVMMVIDLLPDWTPPEWIVYEEGSWAFSAGALVHKLGAWVPVESMGQVLAFIGVILPLVAVVVVVLWLWALVPVVGKK